MDAQVRGSHIARDLTSAHGPADELKVRHLASLPEVYRSITLAKGAWPRRLLSFLGPGYLVAIGYIDPGNWATDLAGGSAFGYSLLWIVLLSNVMAVVLQSLAARLGIVAGLDLAQACRLRYSRHSVVAQWLLSEVAICATDLAEVIGSAIALNLLFHIPLQWGVPLTAFDALLVLWLQQRGFRYFEALIATLLLTVCACLGLDLVLAQPAWGEVASGFIPHRDVFTNRDMLYVAIGIIGATVMPHNLYLHSATVQTRKFGLDTPGRSAAIQYSTIDTVMALTLAFFVNAGILILAAASFHTPSDPRSVGIDEAYRLLAPVVGTSVASLLFGVALLAAGQSSTLTATLAGQVVMEGFIELRLAPWARRLITRAVAIIPAMVAVLVAGTEGIAKLLVLSQAILSLQLPFAVVPLIRMTQDRKLMGALVAPRWLTYTAYAATTLIITLNAILLWKLIVD
jgi:manganese transport protein